MLIYKWLKYVIYELRVFVLVKFKNFYYIALSKFKNFNNEKKTTKKEIKFREN